MGNAAATPALFDDCLHLLIYELKASRSSYFSLLPLELLIIKVLLAAEWNYALPQSIFFFFVNDRLDQLSCFVETALCGAVLLRPPLGFTPASPAGAQGFFLAHMHVASSTAAPTCSAVLQEAFSDCLKQLGPGVIRVLQSVPALLLAATPSCPSLNGCQPRIDARDLSLLHCIPTAQDERLLAVISLRRTSWCRTELVSASYVAITSRGIVLAPMASCNCWIPWPAFLHEVELPEPIEERYHVDDAVRSVAGRARCGRLMTIISPALVRGLLSGSPSASGRPVVSRSQVPSPPPSAVLRMGSFVGRSAVSTARPPAASAVSARLVRWDPDELGALDDAPRTPALPVARSRIL